MPGCTQSEFNNSHIRNPVLEVKVCTLEGERLPTGTSVRDDQFEPVSALYSVRVESGKLLDQIGLDIQHCVARAHESENAIQLLHAHNKDEYYKVMPCTDVGESTLVNVGPKSEDFSWFILVAQRYVLRHINYNAQVFITKSRSGSILSFVITMAFDTCTTVRLLSKLLIFIL